MRRSITLHKTQVNEISLSLLQSERTPFLNNGLAFAINLLLGTKLASKKVLSIDVNGLAIEWARFLKKIDWTVSDPTEELTLRFLSCFSTEDKYYISNVKNNGNIMQKIIICLISDFS